MGNSQCGTGKGDRDHIRGDPTDRIAPKKQANGKHKQVNCK